ncbi:hypothetical protein ACLB2K_043537 [Fragaria x ananassa]
MEIARGVGTPLQIDKATRERQFGYYARILVNIELSHDLPTSLMVEKVTEQPDTEIASLENVNEVHQEPFVPLVDQNALVDSRSDEIIGPIDSTVAVLVCPSEPQLESIVTTRSTGNIVNVTVSNNFEILGQMQE